VGGLDHHKRLDLLFATADLVAAERPEFHLVVAGDGQMRSQVESEAAKRPYVSYVGPRFGEELAVELKGASVMLMPGAVGLGVVDAFAAGLPVVTAAGTSHGPELEYLRSGWNSVIAEPTARSLADATKFAMCPSRRDNFEAGCTDTAALVSLEQMVGRFVGGVAAALQIRRVSERPDD
jgi:glycosyltransferase involved in cell wall biosynthesis